MGSVGVTAVGGSHRSGSRTPGFPERALFGQFWRVVRAVRSVRRESLRKEAWRGRWGDSRSTHLGKQTSGEEAEALQVLEAKEKEEEALGGEKKEKHP